MNGDDRQVFIYASTQPANSGFDGSPKLIEWARQLSAEPALRRPLCRRREQAETCVRCHRGSGGGAER